MPTIKTTEDVQNVLNTIRTGTDENGYPLVNDEYRQIVPEVRALTPMAAISNPVVNLPGIGNQFFSAFVNKVCKMIISERMFLNPFAPFKKGKIGPGELVETLAVNPILEQNYTLDGAQAFPDGGAPTGEKDADNLLSVEKPTVFEEGYRISRAAKLVVSLQEDLIGKAFISYESLGNFMNSTIDMLYESDRIYEYTNVRGLLDRAVSNSQIVTINPPSSSITDVMKTARKCYLNFQFPSNQYNHEGKNMTGQRITWSNPEDIYVIMPISTAVDADFDVLAMAFNMSKVDFMGKVITVPDFENIPGLQFFIVDDRFIQIYDSLYKTRNFDNPANLTTKYWLHHWQTYSTSFYYNGVAVIV